MATQRFVKIFMLVLCATSGFTQDYKAIALNAHNLYRMRHRETGPMTLDENLNSKALICAKYYAAKGEIDHTCEERKGLGENLIYDSWPKSEVEASRRAVDVWYNESEVYNYDMPGFSPQTAHFTQLVWNSSKQLGCGVAKGRKAYFTTCLYLPKGNYKGRYVENVMRPNTAPNATLYEEQAF